MPDRRCVVSEEIVVCPLGPFVGVVQSSDLTVASLYTDPEVQSCPIRDVAWCSRVGSGVGSSR